MTLTLIAVLIALGLMAMAFWQKMIWPFIGAGGFWIVLGIFAMTENEQNTMEWGIGVLYFGLALMCLLSFFWYKDGRSKGDDIERDLEEEDRQEYKKHMNDVRGKGRQL
jgi:hypothetical protein